MTTASGGIPKGALVERSVPATFYEKHGQLSIATAILRPWTSQGAGKNSRLGYWVGSDQYLGHDS